MTFLPKKRATPQGSNVIKMQPGPTQMAVTHTQDIKSSFKLFIPDSMQKIILDCTNLEGKRVLGERWKEMDQIHLHAYFGLLILAGVFRSKWKSAESLWDTETGREIFRATMILENFVNLFPLIFVRRAATQVISTCISASQPFQSHALMRQLYLLIMVQLPSAAFAL